MGRLFDAGDVLLCFETGIRPILQQAIDIFEELSYVKKEAENGGPIHVAVNSHERTDDESGVGLRTIKFNEKIWQQQPCRSARHAVSHMPFCRITQRCLQMHSIKQIGAFRVSCRHLVFDVHYFPRSVVYKGNARGPNIKYFTCGYIILYPLAIEIFLTRLKRSTVQAHTRCSFRHYR